MGYDLKPIRPKKKDLEWFHFNCWSWLILMEYCGTYWPSYHGNGGYYMPHNNTNDKRYEGHSYPPITTNDGFKVTAIESRVMARIASNLARIQRCLPDTLEEYEMQGLKGRPGMPIWMHRGYVERFEEFSEWVQKCQGFRIF